MTDKLTKTPPSAVPAWRAHRGLPGIKQKRKLKRHLDAVETGLIQDLGGPDKISTGQMVLVQSTISCLGIMLLCQAYVNKHGILRQDALKAGDLQLFSILEKSLISYQNTIRLNLACLFPGGLGKSTSRQIIDLRQFYTSESEDGTEKATGEDQGQNPVS